MYMEAKYVKLSYIPETTSIGKSETNTLNGYKKHTLIKSNYWIMFFDNKDLDLAGEKFKKELIKRFQQQIETIEKL